MALSLENFGTRIGYYVGMLWAGKFSQRGTTYRAAHFGKMGSQVRRSSFVKNSRSCTYTRVHTRIERLFAMTTQWGCKKSEGYLDQKARHQSADERSLQIERF